MAQEGADGADGAAAREAPALVVQRGAKGPQQRGVRSDGWTKARRRIFLATLAETANATEAARVVGMSVRGVYALRQKDEGFAQEWAMALDQAYDALDQLLLRMALFGTEEIEIVEDGAGEIKSRKVKRSVPVALGLALSARRARDLERRAEQWARERPDSPAVTQRLAQALQRLRARAAAREAELQMLGQQAQGRQGLGQDEGSGHGGVGAGAVGGAGPGGARPRAGGAGRGRDRAAGP